MRGLSSKLCMPVIFETTVSDRINQNQVVFGDRVGGYPWYCKFTGNSAESLFRLMSF